MKPSPQYTTVCFEGDIRQLTTNPFDVVCPFGKVIIVAVGDVFAERDEMEELLNGLSDWEREELKEKARQARKLAPPMQDGGE